MEVVSNGQYSYSSYSRNDNEDVYRSSFRLFSLWELLVKEFFPAKTIVWQLRRTENFLCEIESRYQGAPWDIQKAAVACSLMDMCTNRFNIPVSKMLAEELKSDVLDGTMSSFEELASGLREFLRRVEDELRSHLFLYVSQGHVKHYVEPMKGWESVIEKWGNTVSDIEEAEKCFALNRYTASVFHLMRLMEMAVQKFGDKLGVKLEVDFVAPKTWHNILSEIDKAVREMVLKKDLSAKSYAEASAHLYNVKVAWRNEVMHPKATYTEEEAESILHNVKTFLCDLVQLL